MNGDCKSTAVINPANEEMIGEIPRQSAADVGWRRSRRA
jgi:hypothetical protein